MKRNIVHDVTGKYMRQNKKRTAATFLGIVFMVLLMTCVFVGKGTGLSFMEQVAQKKDGKWHVSLYNTNQEGLSAVKSLDYVEETAVSANCGNLEFKESKNAERPYLTVKAYTKNCFDWMNIELSKGRLPQNGGEIVISESAIEDGAKLEIGDTLSGEFFERSITGIDAEVEKTVFPFQNLSVKYNQTVEVPLSFPYFGENTSFRENKLFTGKTGTYKVVGMIRKPGFESADAAGYTGITGMDEAEIKELDTFNVSVRIHNAPDMFGVELRELADYEEIEFNDYLLVFSGSSSDSTANQMLGFITVFFVVIIMAASVILIYNVFNISFQERCRYLGMLSSTGATGRQKRSSIYYEAFVLLVPALPVGILLGMAVIKAGITAIKPLLGRFMGLEAYVQDAAVKLRFSLGDIVVIVLVCVATVLISAFLPARKIGKIGAIASIRGNQDRKEKQYVMKLPKRQRFNVEALLAGKTVKRQRKKTASLTMAAVTFMVIMAVTSYGAVSVKNLVNARINRSGELGIKSGKWDYQFGCAGSDESLRQYEAVKEEILKHPGVSDGAQWYDGMFIGQVKGDAYSREYKDAVHEIFNLNYHRELSEEEFEEKSGFTDGRPICVLGVDDETLYEIARKSDADLHTLKDSKKASAVMVRSGGVSTQNTSVEGLTPERFRYFHIENMSDLKQGESMDVELYSPAKDKKSILPVTIAGFADAEDMEDYVWFQSQFMWLIVGEDTCLKLNELIEGSNAFSPMLYFKWNGEDRELLEKLRGLCEENYELYFGALDNAKRMGDAIVSIVNVLAVCFAAVVSVICLLNLFNSIRGRMEERRGEFGIWYSVGMTKKQLRRLLFWENMRVLKRSFAIAGVIAAGLILGLRLGMEKIFGHMALVLPWGWFAASMGITAAAVCEITRRCLKKEKDESLITEIREGM